VVKLRFALDFCMVMALTAFGLGFVPGPILDAGEAAPIPEEDIQVLASGPIHEAFAEAVVLDPEPGIVVPKAPPALIEEIPLNQAMDFLQELGQGMWCWSGVVQKENETCYQGGEADSKSDQYMWRFHD